MHCGCDYKTVLDVDCSMRKFIFDPCYEIHKFSNRYIIMVGGGGVVDVAESRRVCQPVIYATGAMVCGYYILWRFRRMPFCMHTSHTRSVTMCQDLFAKLKISLPHDDLYKLLFRACNS